MTNRVLQLEARSPEGLENTIAGLVEKERVENSFVTLSISGQKVIVRQFELPALSPRELKNSLQLEAAELLSLPPEEVAFDYQILESAADKINGLFVALPRDILEQYYLKINQTKMVPLSITAEILTVIDSFLRKINSASSNFFLLNFAKENTIHLALFNAGRCELLREIRYENISEAKQEIINSLRYAIGKSSSKHPEEIYFSRGPTDKNELITDLENEFGAKGRAVDLKGMETQARETRNYFRINLIKEYTVSLPLRHSFHRVLNLAIGVVFLACLLVLFRMGKLDTLIRNLKKESDPSAKATEYSSKIKDLQAKIKLLEDEK